MALLTITIPTPTLPAGWTFNVEYSASIFGMPYSWTAIADQTNAPFNLILSTGSWVLKVTLDMDGETCEPFYFCFRVKPPCVGCPTPINVSFVQGTGIKYLHVDMLFPAGFPACGLEINAKIVNSGTPYNQTVNFTSIGQLTIVNILGTDYYRKTFVLNGTLAYLTKAYQITVKSLCCSYYTVCSVTNHTG